MCSALLYLDYTMPERIVKRQYPRLVPQDYVVFRDGGEYC